jgi:N-acetylmuramoyl-L-alanine amidase
MLSLKSAVVLACALALFADVAEAKRSKRRSHGAKPKSTASRTSSKKTAPAAVPAPPSEISTVVIDAGHGGHDPGGIPENLMPEKGVALDVAKRLQRNLEQAGLKTVMTRTDDTFISLGERVRIANAQSNAIFVSVHFNSGLRVEARGVETYYGSAASAPLARLIQRNLLTVTVNPDHRPVKHATFWVLRETKLRAVLAECGFLTNIDDTALARQEEHREKVAAQIAAAVIEYVRPAVPAKS